MQKKSKYSSIIIIKHIPNLTGNPGGNFKLTKSRNLAKCLNGAVTSSTSINMATDKGKSILLKNKTKII